MIHHGVVVGGDECESDVLAIGVMHSEAVLLAVATQKAVDRPISGVGEGDGENVALFLPFAKHLCHGVVVVHKFLLYGGVLETEIDVSGVVTVVMPIDGELLHAPQPEPHAYVAVIMGARERCCCKQCQSEYFAKSLLHF